MTGHMHVEGRNFGTTVKAVILRAAVAHGSITAVAFL
jgi:hypothetical protein